MIKIPAKFVLYSVRMTYLIHSHQNSLYLPKPWLMLEIDDFISQYIMRVNITIDIESIINLMYIINAFYKKLSVLIGTITWL